MMATPDKRLFSMIPEVVRHENAGRSTMLCRLWENVACGDDEKNEVELWAMEDRPGRHVTAHGVMAGVRRTLNCRHDGSDPWAHAVPRSRYLGR